MRECLRKEDTVLTRRVLYETAQPGSPQRYHPHCSIHHCIMEDSCMAVDWHGYHVERTQIGAWGSHHMLHLQIQPYSCRSNVSDMGCLSGHKIECSLGNIDIYETLVNYKIIFQAPTFTVYVFAVDTKLSERFEVLMLVTMKITVFWDVMLHFRLDARGTRFL